MVVENSRLNNQTKRMFGLLNIHMLAPILGSLLLTGCFNTPFNDFKSRPNTFVHTLLQPGEKTLIRTLQKQDIQYIEYGDTMTLLVPTDHFFVKGTAKINDICYEGLNNVVRLLNFYPQCHFYVAGFTDAIGTPHLKYQLTKARAEAMLTFLWASGIPAHAIKATGYSDLFAIGNNHLIHGSAYNRRIEIQWSKVCNEEKTQMKIAPADMKK